MSLTFIADIQPEHVRQATAGIFWRQVTKPMVLLGAVVLFAVTQGLLWAVLPMANWRLHALLGLLFLVTVGLAAAAASRHYQDLALRNFERFHGRPAAVRLDAEGYHYSASWGSGHIEWTRFQSLWCLDGVWVLLQHAPDGVSVLLPAGALDDETRAFLLARLADVKGQVLR